MKNIKNLVIAFLCSMLTAAAFAQEPSKELKPYRNYVTRNGLVFVSGQIGTRSFSTRSPSFADEVHQAIKNVSEILEESNLKLMDAVSVTVYLKNSEDFAAFNQIYLQYFKKPFPTRTCVIVKDLVQNATIEITVIAAKK